jgi:nucleoid-associated protein YgaU
MAQQPRGRPPSQAPPPAGRGRNALTLLGGGVLVLAVAGGAWALFGRGSTTTDTNASSSTPTATSAPPVLGPKAGPVNIAPKPSATSTHPAAAPTSAATKAATLAPVVKPTAAASATTPAPVATKAPVVVGPVAKPPVAVGPVVKPQVGGTVAKKDYTFKVARGDTLWDYTVSVLKSSGRTPSNANVAALVTKLYQSNKAVVGSDPNLILPGQTIVWPTGL